MTESLSVPLPSNLTPLTSSRPRLVVNYPGSKARLAPLLAELCPVTRTWVEAFAGSGIVTLSRPPSEIEILNDLCGHACNLFRVLRDQALRERLAEAVDLTPYAREEYLSAPVTPEEIASIDAVEWARRYLVTSWQSFGGKLASGAWGRSVGTHRGRGQTETSRADRWNLIPDRILAVAGRLKRVEISNISAFDLLPAYAHAHVSLYLDPPYPLTTRTRALYYHEFTDADHRRLLALALSHPGPCVISSYSNALYNDALADWERLQLRAYSQLAVPRTEVIWRNLAAVQLAPVTSLSPDALKTLKRLHIAPLSDGTSEKSQVAIPALVDGDPDQ